MRVRQSKTLLAAAAAVLVLILPQTATAAPPPSGLEGIGRTLPDSDLSEMRGKFITPGAVRYFGIQMQTSWQGPDGITTDATLLFTIGFAGGAGNAAGATPQILIGYSRNGDPAMDIGTVGEGYLVVAVPSGLNGVQGAVQSQQIAGDDNHVRNSMRVAIVPASLATAAQPGGLTPVQSGQLVQFADGDKLQFVIAGNQLGIGMTNGGDSMTQGFNGTRGQIAQHVLLGSNNNSLANNISVVIGFDQMEQASRMNLQNIMTSLKGLGF